MGGQDSHVDSFGAQFTSREKGHKRNEFSYWLKKLKLVLSKFCIIQLHPLFVDESSAIAG